MKTVRTKTEIIETEIAPGIFIVSKIENGSRTITRLRGMPIEIEHLEMLPEAIEEHLIEVNG